MRSNPGTRPIPIVVPRPERGAYLPRPERGAYPSGRASAWLVGLPIKPGGDKGSGESGFTLLEVLVALAVLGAVLATAYGVFASGLRNISRGDERLTLALMAESLLNRADLDLARGGGGAVEGSLPDGVRWRITRQPYDLERLKEGLTVVERPPPPRPGADGGLLNPAEGREGGPLGRREDDRGGGSGSGAREGGGGGFGLNSGDRRGAGMGEGRAGLGGPSGGGGLSSGAGEGGQLGTDGDRAGRAGGGAAAPVKLRAWLVRVEVANARGESFALAKLSLEREQRAQRQGQGQGQGQGRERAR